MDLFLEGIPLRASHDNVVTAIAAVVHAPPVHRPGKKMNFEVQVFRPKKSSVPKSLGKITIENIEAGQRLLRYVVMAGGIPLHQDRIKVAPWTGRRIDATLVERLQKTEYEDPESEAKRKQEMQGDTLLDYAAFGRMVAPNRFNAELVFPAMSIAASIEKRELSFVLHDALYGSSTTVCIHFSSIDDCVVSSTSLYLLLETAPMFLKSKGTTPGRNGQAWMRRSSPNWLGEVIPELTYVGTTLKLAFRDVSSITAFCKIYRTFNLPSMDRRSVSTQQKELYGAKLETISDWFRSLSLPIAFELEILLRRRIILPNQLWSLRSHIKVLWHETSKDPSQCIQVFQNFATKLIAMNDADLEDPLDIATVFEDSCVTYRGTQFPHLRRPLFQMVGTMQIYHATVTPTGLFIDGPYVDQSNATIRRFPGFEHNFLRVSFWEEHGCRLRMEMDVDLSDLIKSRFGVVLKNGLDVAGRHFSFLGYSSSALRDHATWFVTPFEDANGNLIDAETIIRDSGQYRDMSCPARYGARLAQNFTATAPSVTLQPSQITQVKDWVSTRGSVMTDGCGAISPALLDDVAEKLDLKMQPYAKISALQFRLGGYKGVLVRNESLQGKQIVVRPSMSKFDGRGDQQLDIARPFVHPQILFLNRTMIQQLEGRGVPSEVFEDLQEAQMSTIREATTSLVSAAKLLTTAGLGTQFGLVGLFRNLYKYMKVGFNVREGEYTINTRFIRTCVSVVLRHVLRDLKHHARIPVRGSWTLVGVSDEHDCLEEGEIYSTIRTRDGEKIPLLGKIAVSRSPQEHPGDIQFAKGVHREELAYLENVVVFSCKGQRSLPSCLGGGDLDGDEYNLIMDRNLHPVTEVKPASYVGKTPKKLDKTCNIDDIADFVLEYFVSDVLGMIAHRRLQIADQSSSGTMDPRCIHLGELASYAVDYPKTGVAVAPNEIDKPDDPLRPDFMSPEEGVSMKPREGYYRSDKTLGILFRQINLDRDSRLPPLQDYHDVSDLHDVVSRFDPTPWGLDPLSKPPKEKLERMMEMFEVYSFQLTIISHSHTMSRSQTKTVTEGTREYLSEAEVIVGSILYASNDRRKRQNLVQRLGSQTQELFSRLKEEIFSDLESHNDKFQAAWTAYKAGGTLIKQYGGQSFQLFALGCMLSILKEIDEERVKMVKELRQKMKKFKF